MTINVNANSLKNRLNDANPQVLPDMLRIVGIGNILRALPVTLVSILIDGATAPLGVATAGVAATNPYVIAAAHSVTLPDDAKAAYVMSAWARSGTGTKGNLTVDTAFVDETSAPSAGHVGLAETGDLLFNATDAWTRVDVLYMPAKYDVVELILPVVAASGLCTLPATAGLPMFVLEAEALTGTVTGKCIVDPPIDTQSTTKHCSMKLAKSSVLFTIADAVTQARVKFAIASGIDSNALLTAVSNML